MQTAKVDSSSIAAVVGATALVLTACGDNAADDEMPEVAPPSESADEGADETEAEETSADFESIAAFCESEPEIDGDEDRLAGASTLPSDEDPAPVPLPYLEQLEDDPDFDPPTEQSPAENVPEPQVPGLICEDSLEGREAALSYFLELELYGELTRDLAPMQALHTEQCQSCDEFAANIQSMADEEVWILADPPYGVVHFWQPAEDPEVWSAFMESEWPDYVYFDDQGEVGSGEAVTSTYALNFAYDDGDGHWRVDAVLDASMGDEALDRLDGQQEGEDAPETLEDPSLPEPPELLSEESPEGALAASEYWLEVLDYTAATGDESALNSFEHSEGSVLGSIFEGFLEAHAEGGDVSLLAESSLEDIEVYMDIADSDDNLAVVHGLLDEGGWVISDASGATVAVDEGLQGELSNLIFSFDDAAGQWLVVDMAPGDVGELEEFLGIEFGEPDLSRR